VPLNSQAPLTFLASRSTASHLFQSSICTPYLLNNKETTQALRFGKLRKFLKNFSKTHSARIKLTQVALFRSIENLISRKKRGDAKEK
jgi:hypothetical protein